MIGEGTASNENDKIFDYSYLSYFLYEKLAEKAEISKYLRELKENLKEKHFFIKTDLLDYLKTLSEKTTIKISNDKPYYRARVIQDKDALLAISDYENILLNITNKTIENLHGNLDKPIKWLHIIGWANENDISDFDEQEREKLNEFAEKNMVGFFGYTGADAGAAPKGKTGDGRVNATGVSHLYMSDNANTAIWECNPRVGQFVSVAEFEIIRELKIFDVSYPIDEKNNIKEQDFKDSEDVILDKIAMSFLFSTPNNGEIGFYYPTQYISEYIQTLGFDGIQFTSSIDNNKNLVLYNVNNYSLPCIQKNSSIHFVAKHNKIEQILPVPLA